jgi:hypothetical protein
MALNIFPLAFFRCLFHFEFDKMQMVDRVGLEPTTKSLRGSCSTN